jgi:hypothetical protein
MSDSCSIFTITYKDSALAPEAVSCVRIEKQDQFSKIETASYLSYIGQHLRHVPRELREVKWVNIESSPQSLRAWSTT